MIRPTLERTDKNENNQGRSPIKVSPRVINSAELLNGHRELLIEHNGELYRLRHTQRGKLYLTKAI